MFKRSQTAGGNLTGFKVRWEGEETSGSNSEISPRGSGLVLLTRKNWSRCISTSSAMNAFTGYKKASSVGLGNCQGSLLSIYNPTGLAAALARQWNLQRALPTTNHHSHMRPPTRYEANARRESENQRVGERGLCQLFRYSTIPCT